MMRWLILWLLLAGPVWAETITVSSGEHDGYSRLVLPLPVQSDWQLGRTDAGYELALTGDDLRFDLSGVFDLIPKTRLTGVFVDPATGRLQLSLSCACHALPFQLDARTLVIDLRDGAAPPASSFEQMLDGTTPAPLVAAAQPRPRIRPQGDMMARYDWLSVRADAGLPVPVMPDAPVGAPLRANLRGLAPLRDRLLQQLSRGAADGVIQLALPEGEPEAEAMALDENGQVRVTNLPGMAVQPTRGTVDSLQPDGMACLPDSVLNVTAWGGAGDAAAQIATARAALVGEFDRPDQLAVAQAVRLQLNMGFGAETELMIAGFGATDADVPVWISLARILDDRAQTANAFANMAGCDTAAALWAVLSVPDDVPLADINVAAVQRAFSALPPHLRLQLGPRLADRALVLGDVELARSVATATNRPTQTPVGSQALLQAEVDMAAGRVAEVATAMADLLAQGGPTSAEALILLIEAKVALAEPVTPDLPEVAASLLREYAGSVLEPKLQRAWLLSMAAAGDFDGVFDADHDAGLMPEVWQLLASIGTDDAVLKHAVLPAGTPVVAEWQAAKHLAARLLALGFADAAAQWVTPWPPDATDADRQLLGQIDLARNDGRAVLTTLAGQTAPAALVLKAQAEQLLGQPDLARLSWAEAGDAAASVRAAGWAQNWAEVSSGGSGAWQASAALVAVQSTDPAVAAGPLAKGQALVADSAAVRAALDVLLQSVPQP